MHDVCCRAYAFRNGLKADGPKDEVRSRLWSHLLAQHASSPPASGNSCPFMAVPDPVLHIILSLAAEHEAGAWSALRLCVPPFLRHNKGTKAQAKDPAHGTRRPRKASLGHGTGHQILPLPTACAGKLDYVISMSCVTHLVLDLPWKALTSHQLVRLLDALDNLRSCNFVSNGTTVGGIFFLTQTA